MPAVQTFELKRWQDSNANVPSQIANDNANMLIFTWYICLCHSPICMILSTILDIYNYSTTTLTTLRALIKFVQV